MKSELPIRLVLVDPPAGIDFGIQRGRGAAYETLFVQQRKHQDISFDFALTVSGDKGGRPNFTGPFAQGPPEGRFIYIDVGTYAGQKNTPWSRRMKIPLEAITWPLIKTVLGRPGHALSASIPGTGRDGGPSCATVKPLGAWEVIRS